MTDVSFNPARLTFARARRGLTKKNLAEAIGVSAWTVSAYENGTYTPNDQHLQMISGLLDFPIPFFALDDLRPPKPDQASFRSMSRMTAGQRVDTMLRTSWDTLCFIGMALRPVGKLKRRQMRSPAISSCRRLMFLQIHLVIHR